MFLDVTAYTDRLIEVYKKLDDEYRLVADEYEGFSCEGCESICCDQVFIHLTLIEHFHLLEGFRKLPAKRREEILERAEEYNRGFSATSSPEENFRMLCPLCEYSRCTLHPYRPLLCRVYGLPGKLVKPSGEELLFDGCARFKKKFSRVELRLNRTEFFASVAEIEKDLRKALAYFQRYRKTVAQMLLDEKRRDALIMRAYDFFEGY
ncbi:MAG: hypothetical protein D6726_09835 [Nitrospirae bacterium]|nr:MAG: hypothetical protein D6726_09835 [Nitrospirota bacterium]